MTTVMVRTLCCAVLLLLSVSSSQALRSCTRLGQAVVPCEDELLLEQRDRFLITLFGHSCYSIRVASVHALDVYFYDTNDWAKQLGVTKARTLRAIPSQAHGLPGGAMAYWINTMQVCHDAVDCHVEQANRSAHALYDLVIARSSFKAPVSDTRVRLRIDTCDAVSKWFYVGLVATAFGGFFTMLFLLCVISEFLLGVHTYSTLRRKLGLQVGNYPHPFVELAQFDPLDQSGDDGNALDKSASFALSATADANEQSDDDQDGDNVYVQCKHADAMAVRAAEEA